MFTSWCNFSLKAYVRTYIVPLLFAIYVPLYIHYSLPLPLMSPLQLLFHTASLYLPHCNMCLQAGLTCYVYLLQAFTKTHSESRGATTIHLRLVSSCNMLVIPAEPTVITQFNVQITVPSCLLHCSLKEHER